MKSNKIDVDTLRKLVCYDSKTGLFTFTMSGKPALQSKMNRGRYYNGMVGGSVMLAHRAAWAYFHGTSPDGVIDHINGDGLDNRICNLRCVTPKENGHNRIGLNKNNTSGITGVVKDNRRGGWRAAIKIDRKEKYLGTFEDINDAIAARRAAEIEHFPEIYSDVELLTNKGAAWLDGL